MAGLSKHLEGKFKMVKYHPGKFRLRSGKILDTRSCTLKDAEEAIANGFLYLKATSTPGGKKAKKKKE